jgi:hypothetical protein
LIFPSFFYQEADITQVARKKFVDDFSTLAVEKCLLEPLSTIFSSRIVECLADDIVGAIAAEDETSKLERGRLALKVDKLQSGLHRLHRLDRHVASEMHAFLIANLELMNRYSHWRI